MKNERCGMLTSSVLIRHLHDNEHLHTAACTLTLLERFSLELLGNPLYSPYLALSDLHLFSCLKNWLQSQCFSYNEEFM